MSSDLAHLMLKIKEYTNIKVCQKAVDHNPAKIDRKITLKIQQNKNKPKL